MQSLSCQHKRRKPPSGKLHIEIRHFDTKIPDGNNDEEFHLMKDEVECSLCFVENVNKVQTRRRQESNDSKRNYFPAPNVNRISIPMPSSYKELQQVLAKYIPKSYGPAIIERADGSQIYPRMKSSELFKDEETITFREIRPSINNDSNLKNNKKNPTK